MRPFYTLAWLCLLAPSALFAQKNCKKGIPCGGTCIAANKTCRVGTSSPAPRPASEPMPQAATGTKATTTEDLPSSSVKVWVNSKSHVYHCSGTRWYGVTKNGSYMTESAAKAAGNRAAYGKGCGS